MVLKPNVPNPSEILQDDTNDIYKNLICTTNDTYEMQIKQLVHEPMGGFCNTKLFP